MRHHLLELGEGEVGIGGVAPGGGEEADRVVAPVVLQPLLEKVTVVDEGVDRQQLDGADAQRRQVAGDLRRREPGIGAAQRFGHGRMPLGEASRHAPRRSIVFSHDGAPPRRAAPAEGRVDDAASIGEGRAVALVERQVVAASPSCSRTGRGSTAACR